MPAAWLKKYFVGFRMIRVPARFNLFASVAASLVACAGLKHLLSKIPGRRARVALFGIMASVALVDLGWVPYFTYKIPHLPQGYAAILRNDPNATFVDVPQFNSGAFQLPAVCTYWQSFHGGKTSAGYTAFLNGKYDNSVYYNSPFDAFRLAQINYLTQPWAETFELAQSVDFKSYAWLYLKVHDLRYVVVHHRPGDFPEFPVYLERLEALLKDAKVFEDADTAIFDRELLPRPTQPVALYTEGWGDRTYTPVGRSCMVGRLAKVQVYNPDPTQPVAFGLEVSANLKPRTVKLRANGAEVVEWNVGPTESRVLVSPPLTSKANFVELTIESDGEDRPSSSQFAAQGFKTPFSLWASRVGVMAFPKNADVARQPNPTATR
jgi:hypothetical protein